MGGEVGGRERRGRTGRDEEGGEGILLSFPFHGRGGRGKERKAMANQGFQLAAKLINEAYISKPANEYGVAPQRWEPLGLAPQKRKGKERKGKGREGKGRKGKERKGKDRQGKGREGKGRGSDCPRTFV